MVYVNETKEIIYEINKSKFITTISSFNNFKQLLEIAKENHPKASHYVWAYRHQVSNNLFERVNDDGEPKSCAGKPTLNILQKLNIINTVIITTRYFGGTRLGAGGLIRAYGNSAKLSVEASILRTYIKLDKTTKIIHLKNLDLFRHTMKEYEIIEEGIEYSESNAIITISAIREQLYSFILEIKDKQII